MFRSLRTRFLVTLLISVAVPFLAFGWFAVDQMESRLKDDIHAIYLQKVAVDTAHRIENQLEQWEWELRLLASSTQMMKMALTRQSGPVHYWIERNVHASVYQLLLIADERGQLQFSNVSPGRGAQEQEEITERLPPSVARDEWFQRMMAGGGLLFLDRHRSPYLTRTPEVDSKDPLDYSLGIAVEILAEDGKTRVGALLGLLSWKEVQEELDTVAKYFRDTGSYPSGSAFMFANDGDKVIAHQSRSLYNRSLTRDAPLLSELARQFRESVVSGGQGSAEYQNTAGNLRRSAWKQLDRPAPCNWFVCVGIDIDDIFKTAREFRNLLLLAVGFTVLAIVVWSFLISRLVLRRVAALRTATLQLATGDTSVRVPVAGTDELADLGRAFNQTAEDLEKSQAALRRVERDAAWVEIARQVAHEIKNPLTPMRLSAQMLEKALDEQSDKAPEIARRAVKTVLSQTDALRRIASDFSLFAGRVQPKLVPVDVDQCLQRVAELYAAGRAQGAIPVRVLPEAGPVKVQADAEDLTRVLINLVNNSIDAMSDASSGGEVVVRSRRLDGHVEIEVEDDGPGLPPEVLHRLFEPYFSTKSHGTGLGLAIVKRTIEGFGGTVALTARPQGGTRAVVRLAASS